MPEVYLNQCCIAHRHDLVFLVFLDVKFLRFALLRQQKVCHFKLVDLDHLERNLESVIRLLVKGRFEVLKCMLNQPSHGVCFACPRLSMRDDGGFQALDGALNQ